MWKKVNIEPIGKLKVTIIVTNDNVEKQSFWFWDGPNLFPDGSDCISGGFQEDKEKS